MQKLQEKYTKERLKVTSGILSGWKAQEEERASAKGEGEGWTRQGERQRERSPKAKGEEDCGRG
jgi:hypothetical protein